MQRGRSQCRGQYYAYAFMTKRSGKRSGIRLGCRREDGTLSRYLNRPLIVLAVLSELLSNYFQSVQWNLMRIWMPAATEHPTARFQPAGQPEGILYRGLPDVIKRPMKVGTEVHCLKLGLYGLVRDLLLDVELFMANATRSTSPPHSGVSTSGRGRRLTSNGSRAAASPPPLLR
jgi:hypothetical protein